MLLFVDCETGGLDPQRHDLLQVGMIAYDDEKGRIVDMDSFNTRHYWGLDHVALEVNGIDPHKHNKDALGILESRKRFETFVHANFKNKVTLAGWNVHFDKRFLEKLYDHGQHAWWTENITSGIMDVRSVLQFLSISCDIGPFYSLDDALNCFGVGVKGRRHTAIPDALATCELFMVVSKSMKDMSGFYYANR